MKLKRKENTRIYRGFDNTRSLSVSAGESVDVSDAKGAQLLKDFPGEWEVLEEKTKPAPSPVVSTPAPARAEPAPAVKSKTKKARK